MTVIGTGVGWSAIVPKIQADPNSGFNVTQTDVRWLGKFLIFFLIGLICDSLYNKLLEIFCRLMVDFTGKLVVTEFYS